jgi:hypothetical protein
MELRGILVMVLSILLYNQMMVSYGLELLTDLHDLMVIDFSPSNILIPQPADIPPKVLKTNRERSGSGAAMEKFSMRRAIN